MEDRPPPPPPAGTGADAGPPDQGQASQQPSLACPATVCWLLVRLHLFSPFPGSNWVFMLTQRGHEADSTSLFLSQPSLGTVAGSRRAEAKSR